MSSKNCKISIRITPWQEQVLSELAESLGVGYSLLVRTIIGSWLETNEEYVYKLVDKKIIEKKQREYAHSEQIGKEEKEDYAKEGNRYEEDEAESISKQELEEIERYLLEGTSNM